MRSLFAKTLLWFLATTAVGIGGIIITTAATFSSTEPRGPVGMLLNMQVEQAKRAYETGGREALAAALSKFQQITQFKVLFTDAKGTDLLTGRTHPELLRVPKRRGRWRVPFPFGGRPPVIAREDATGQYRLFIIDQRRDLGFFFLQPQHLWIIGLVVLVCYGFAYHLTSPVRRLRSVVEGFGRGDFSARAPSSRKDELGELARSFNQMASRIQTLLAAERRLLLDISHELRSPLARLGVAVELARSGEDREHMLDRIQKEADRLNELVAELLQVTRVEADPSMQKNDIVHLDELLGDLVYDSLLEAKAKECTLLLKAPVPAVLSGDEELIRRALENVIRNAIRYAPRNTSVDVELDKSAAAAIVSVRDYGPGVPTESLPRIFDPFYRVDSDRNRASGGLGLGLAIARRSVELHKGKLSAQNANPGLLVTIQLPLAAAQALPGGAKPVAAATPVSTV
ncbi:MAG TPA: ATP-binding protein [Bryobacteraceae bacterium]|jgi:signal transduction histidine kinase|nr:ATP-binding protein [Bryobacteraceae bacterium]